MLLKKILILWILLLVSLLSLSTAGEMKEIIFTGTVVDVQGQPIAGASVKFYDGKYTQSMYTVDIADAEEIKSDTNGRFSIVKKTDYPYGHIVVEKEGLAFDCAQWNKRESLEFQFKLGEPKELTGIVVDENGKPVADARVGILMLFIGGYEERHYLDTNTGSKILNRRTDSAGKFSFMNLPANATVELLVQKAGMATVSTLNPAAYNRESLNFSPGQKDIKIIQPDESKIEGIVVDKNSGQPVAGANLIIRLGLSNQVYGQELITSKEDGSFNIEGLTAGSYNIIFSIPRKGIADWVAQPVNVTLDAGQTKKDVQVELGKGGLFEARVTEAGTDKALQGVSAYLYSERIGQSFIGTSDKDGNVRMRLLPGVYVNNGVFLEGYSSINQQEEITIEEGSTKRIEWRLSSMPKASGVVFDNNGKTVKGAKLCILPGGGGRDIESDAEGKFEINWDVERFSDEREYPLLVCRNEEKNLAKVVILEGNTENLEVKLEPGITIAGKVTNPKGKGIRDAGIRMMLRQTMWASTFIRGDTTKTDTEGNFEVKAIPAEYNYEITVRADGYGSQQKDVHADDAVNNLLDAGTFTLPVANLTISGVVVDVEGNPISDARIESYNHEGGQPEQLNTQADSMGKFTLKGVCEGRVDIRVSATVSGKRVSARATADGGTSGIKIIASERGQYVTQHFTNKTYEQIIQDSEKVIAGIVVDENDVPVSGVSVGVNAIKRERMDAPGKYTWTYSSYENLSSITDKQGRFVIALEEDVQYDLIFSPHNYAAVLVYDVPAGKKDLKVVLSKGGTISGQLFSMEGNKKIPIANVEVKLEQTDRASYTHLGFDQDKTTTTDSQGRFKFERIQTKIRPGGSRSQSEWEFVPRVWQLVYGDNTQTFAFYDKPVIVDFDFIIGHDLTSTSQLKGSTLPDFKGIKIDFNKEKAKEKLLLVCFFDIEQRPSRSCILELNKKSKEIKTKEIEVFLIHASNTEKEYLDNWLRENNISFTVGMIETDEEQTKFNWGVKALPWLILTDKEHVVTDEGFSINDLDEKIQN